MMGNIKIIRGVFDTKLELQHAGVKAGFPSPAEDYIHETLDFNRDYIRHPEASFYGEFTIKYLDLTHKSEGYIELRPANPDYPVFKIEAGDDFQVWGVVIHLIRTFESI